jgi:hypothetical protein
MEIRINKTSYLIAVLLFSVLLGLVGCSDSSDDSSDGTSGGIGNTATEEEIVYVVSKIFESLDSIASSSSISGGSDAIRYAILDSCITTSPSPVTDLSSFTVTYTSCSFSDSDVVASGTLDFTSSVSGSTITIEMEGTINGTGGNISTMVFDLTIIGPWDSTNNDFAGDPTSVTGTITADETSHSAADITWSGDGSSSTVTDPHFLAVGGLSIISYSENGSEWGPPNVTAQTAASESLHGVDCDPAGLCIAVGSNGTVFYSSTGTSWTEATTTFDHSFTGVAYGNSRWVAVGQTSDESSGVIIYSDDSGVTWTEAISTGVSLFNDVAYGNGIWIASSRASQQYWSTDGITWTVIDLQNSITDQTSGFWLRDIVYGNGVWVGVGANGLVVYSATPTDDTSWSRGAHSSEYDPLTGVNYGDGRFIAVGGGSGWAPKIIVSDDNGQTWTLITLPSEFTEIGNGIDDIAYGNSRWSAMTYKGEFLLSTDNGDTWSLVGEETYGGYAISYRP